MLKIGSQNFFLSIGLAAQIALKQKSHTTTSRTGYLDQIFMSLKSQIILYFVYFALQKSILTLD